MAETTPKASLSAARNLLNELSAPFDPSEVKQRTQGGRQLDYVSIDATINRLNKVLGMDWSFEVVSQELTHLNDGGYVGVVHGRLTIPSLGKTADGVGADTAKSDPDKVLKTALAEALKKAGHQLGIGLYLWNESEREILSKQRSAVAGDVGAMKALLFGNALEGGASATAESVAAFYGVTVDSLRDESTIQELYSKVK